MQQSIALHRLSAGEDGLAQVRRLLGYRTSNGLWEPRRLQILVWQVPVMMLNLSITLLSTGLLIVVWGGTEDHRVRTTFLTPIAFLWSGDPC